MTSSKQARATVGASTLLGFTRILTPTDLRFLSSLLSDLNMRGHFLIVLNDELINLDEKYFQKIKEIISEIIFTKNITFTHAQRGENKVYSPHHIYRIFLFASFVLTINGIGS